MNNRWMITAAAAALIAGSGFAYAQGMGGGREGGAAGGAGMQQSAPSSPSAGGTNREHEGSAGMKSSQSEERGGAANRSAQHEMKGAQKGTVGQSSAQEKSAREAKQETKQETKGDRSKSMSSQNEENGAAARKAEGQQRDGNMKAEEQQRNGNMKAEGRNGNATTAAEGNRTQTTGQAGAGAKLSGEQRTRITSIIHNQHVAPVNSVNFAVSVGTRVPRDIGFHPLPTEIVSIYPEWRGYEFFLVRDEIVVVDPRTLEIVDVLPA
jgi:Protein of unknown function (DUF1236)